jgi:hypothetical protein
VSLKCGREDDLGHARQRIGPELAFGGESRHDTVSRCTHQDRVISFGLLSQPR